MKPSEVLRGAAELIRTKGWTRRVYARATDRTEVDYASDEAESFCSIGAIARVGGQLPGSAGLAAHLAPLSRVIGGDGTLCWNDDPERTADEVIAKMLEAAALAESEGQ